MRERSSQVIPPPSPLSLFQAYIIFLYIGRPLPCRFALLDIWCFASLCPYVTAGKDQRMRQCMHFHKNWSINNFAAFNSPLVSADFIFPINPNSIITNTGKMKQVCGRFIVVLIPGFYQYLCVQKSVFCAEFCFYCNIDCCCVLEWLNIFIVAYKRYVSAPHRYC